MQYLVYATETRTSESQPRKVRIVVKEKLLTAFDTEAEAVAYIVRLRRHLVDPINICPWNRLRFHIVECGDFR